MNNAGCTSARRTHSEWIERNPRLPQWDSCVPIKVRLLHSGRNRQVLNIPFGEVIMPENEKNSLVRGLLRIHAVVSRGLNVALERSQAYAHGEPCTPELLLGLADYLQAFASVLHGHHTGEDEIAFPALHEGFPEAPWSLLLDEHRAAVPILADLEKQVARLREAPSKENCLPLAETLEQLAMLWSPHYAREEALFTESAVGALITSDEQDAMVARLGEHSQQHTGPDYLVLPFLLYNLERDERLAMSGLFPPVVSQQLVPVVWKDKWAAMKPFLLEA
jgi:hemerythrin-like domain-containing protein